MKTGVRILAAVVAGFAAMAGVVAAFKMSGNPPSNAIAGGVGCLVFYIAWLMTKPKPPSPP